MYPTTAQHTSSELSAIMRHGRERLQIGLTGLFLFVASVAGTAFAQPPGVPLPAGDIQVMNKDLVLDNHDLVIRDSAGVRIRLDAQSGDIRLLDSEGETVVLIQNKGRNILLGGHGRAGDLVLLPRGATNQNVANASVHLDGSDGTQRLGGGGTNGRLVLRNGEGKQRIFLSGATADLTLGQEGRDGDVFVRNATGEPTITLDGASGNVTAGKVSLNGANGRIRAGQILSDHSASAGSGGIDTASVYLESGNPAIGLRDNTSGNTQGWLIQAGSTGTLNFHAGNLDEVNNRVFVLKPDGGVCIGACE